MSTEVGQRYRHYKGKEYTVLCLGFESTTTQRVVIYQGHYIDPVFGENPIWTRSLNEFLSSVEHEGRRVPRFARIEQTK